MTMKQEQEITISYFKPLQFGDHQSKLNNKEIDTRGGVVPNLKIWDIDFGAGKWVVRSHLWTLERRWPLLCSANICKTVACNNLVDGSHSK